MVADMVAFVASQFTTSTWDVGAQELCSVVLINIEASTRIPSTSKTEVITWYAFAEDEPSVF